MNYVACSDNADVYAKSGQVKNVRFVLASAESSNVDRAFLREIGPASEIHIIAGAIDMSVTISAIDVKDVDPAAAWSALKGDPMAQLIDVRTKAEWSYVGLPTLDTIDKKPILIEWQTFPSMAEHPQFVMALQSVLTDSELSPEASLYFLCRSGARSKAAAGAMIEAGWMNSFNIAGGFEGSPDANGHRGLVNGWKAAGLPWSQS